MQSHRRSPNWEPYTMQTDAELYAESWYQTTSRVRESGRSLCHFDRLPCRCRYCYHYSVRLFRPYRLNQLLCLYRSRFIPLLDLFTARSARSTILPNCSNQPVPFYYSYQLLFQLTVLLLLLLLLLSRLAILLLLFNRSVPLFRLFYHYYSSQLPPTNCY